jgi:NADP-dependent aldehyde dehydrogenase
MSTRPVLIAGRWRPSQATGTFRVDNPATKQPLPDEFPISSWQDCDEALAAAAEAAVALRKIAPSKIAEFLEAFAARIEARKEELVAMANAESGLPRAPRLAEVELPRTTGQLRQAAAAAAEGSWALPTIDTKTNIRSCLAGIGPVIVFGPNNFPFAFNSAAGGDFAAAIAAGNPVIAKANSSHPGTTRILAEEAEAAAGQVGLPPATVQLIYRTGHADGERLVSDPRVGATGYTGSRGAGLKLKAAADAAGKPIYLELSSVNPVVVLPGALEERLEEVAGEFTTSCLMGTGQFCTNPGFVLLQKGPKTDAFIKLCAEKFAAAPVGTLLSKAVEKSLNESVATLVRAGAEVLAGGKAGGGAGYSFTNTLLLASADLFLRNHQALQTEAFGPSSLFVVADDLDQLCRAIDHVEGSLTGCIYSHRGGADDPAYERVAFHLRPLVGRLLNDKMPTGVAVSPGMNHGGPYPSTGHAGFTAVGIPASLRRFAALHCYDNVRPHRLPPALQDKNPGGRLWRLVDLEWTQRSL